ncbi:MAG: amidohydrolase family protein [Candidatus Hydrogenedentota bacterium]
MRIDIHAHVYADPRFVMPSTGTPFMSAEQQLEVMKQKGIDMAVILPLASAEAPAEKQSMGEVLGICEKYPGKFIPFYNVDPRLPRDPMKITVEEHYAVLAQCRELGFKGLGEVTARVYWDDHPMECLLGACEKVGFPVTFHTITPDVNSYGVLDELGMPRFEKCLQKFPDLIFFGHSQGFWSEISGDVTLETKNIYPKTPVVEGGVIKRLMREYPGVYGDLSAGSGLNALQRDPMHAYAFMEEFQDRLLLGQDYCSPKNHMEHVEWLTAARDERNISEEVYEKIMWKNANRVLNLGLE